MHTYIDIHVPIAHMHIIAKCGLQACTVYNGPNCYPYLDIYGLTYEKELHPLFLSQTTENK